MTTTGFEAIEAAVDALMKARKDGHDIEAAAHLLALVAGVCKERDGLREAIKVLADIPLEEFGKENKPNYPLMRWNDHRLDVKHVLDARAALAATDEVQK